MNLRQYFSISLLRDEALSCLVLVNDRFIKREVRVRDGGWRDGDYPYVSN